MSAATGPTGVWSPLLDAAIRRFQKRRGLKVDGWLSPGGPSVRGVKSMEEFVERLQTAKPGLGKYNSEKEDPITKKTYDQKLFEQYETIIRRQSNWRSRRAS